MSRVPKMLSYTFSSDPPLKAEAHSHRMKGKAGKPFRGPKAPTGHAKKSSQFTKDVHYGSHSAVGKAIGAEMKRLGL